MGDMNCRPGSPEMNLLFKRTRLREPLEETLTFPSWRPQHHIDHILVSPELEVQRVYALQHAYSDHLPIAMELSLPNSIQMTRIAA
jgi:endonuclease/exonuclease/phosphatase family metal-dependent hydrolase